MPSGPKCCCLETAQLEGRHLTNGNSNSNGVDGSTMMGKLAPRLATSVTETLPRNPKVHTALFHFLSAASVDGLGVWARSRGEPNVLRKNVTSNYIGSISISSSQPGAASPSQDVKQPPSTGCLPSPRSCGGRLFASVFRFCSAQELPDVCWKACCPRKIRVQRANINT